MSTRKEQERMNQAKHIIIFWIILFIVFVSILRIPGVIEFLNGDSGDAIDYKHQYEIMSDAFEQIEEYIDEISYASERLSYGSNSAWLLLSGQDPDYNPDDAVLEIENSWEYYSEIESCLSSINGIIDDIRP
jgi:hypothetical protein